MRILSIETSCDETAVSIIEVFGDFPNASYEVLGNALYSQVEIHREFGGVYPSIAKREHAATLVPMLEKALNEANIPPAPHHELYSEQKAYLGKLLEREPGLADNLIACYERYNTASISLISVTAGPGLEPALWVGVNFAKALSYLWDVPVVAVNHMEGHVLASVFDGKKLAPLAFPALALLISGGHTELIKMDDWQQYEKVGQTRDDAVGEAFDKVARLMGLPYPGGPEISRLAAQAREANLPPYKADMPRPMLTADNLDFSFSGIKTSVRYSLEGKTLRETDKQALARDFEDAVTEVLLKKTARAVAEFGIQSLILGGGVSANSYIREQFTHYFKTEYPEVAVYLPDPKLSTDNSVMIALAGHARQKSAAAPGDAIASITANGNRSLALE